MFIIHMSGDEEHHDDNEHYDDNEHSDGESPDASHFFSSSGLVVSISNPRPHHHSSQSS